MENRPSWDQHFFEMCKTLQERVVCPRRAVTSIAVKNKRIMGTAYNGPPENFPHPETFGGCIKDRCKLPSGQFNDACSCAHAEQNLIINLARSNHSIEDATIYITTQPCIQCARMLANCGIKEIIFKETYNDDLGVSILAEVGVEMYVWDQETDTRTQLKPSKTYREIQEEIYQQFKQ